MEKTPTLDRCDARVYAVSECHKVINNDMRFGKHKCFKAGPARAAR